jgi:hypothetical protein
MNNSVSFQSTLNLMNELERGWGLKAVGSGLVPFSAIAPIIVISIFNSVEIGSVGFFF